MPVKTLAIYECKHGLWDTWKADVDAIRALQSRLQTDGFNDYDKKTIDAILSDICQQIIEKTL